MKRLDIGSFLILTGDDSWPDIKGGGGDDSGGGGGDALEPDGVEGSVRAILAGRGIDMMCAPIGGGLRGRLSGLGRTGFEGVEKVERDEP